MRLCKAIGQARRGVTVVECAIVYPITFLLLLGLVIGALGVFRYQEVASLARAGARYASTHGDQFRKDAGWGTGQPGTADGNSNGYFWYKADPMASSGSDTSWAGDMYDKAVRPNLIGIDPANLTVKMGFPAVINQPNQPDNWPGSKVAVHITYKWMPELFFVGPIYLTSTSTMQITN
jgi:TadE-like protein